MNQRSYQRIGIILGVILILFVGPFVAAPFFSGLAPMERDTELLVWTATENPADYRGIIQEYMAQQPKVYVTMQKKRSLEELEQDLINELAEGKGPDLVIADPSWVLKHKGKFAALPSASSYADPANFRAVFSPMTAVSLIEQGEGGTQIHGLPLSVEPLALIYNQDYFLQNFASSEPAELWEVFEEQVLDEVRTNRLRTIVQKTPIALGRLDNIERGMDILHLLMVQLGTNFYDPALSQVTLTEPVVQNGRRTFPSITALDTFAKFGREREDSFLWSLEQTADDQEAKELGAFVRGEIGMIFGYPFTLKQINEQIELAIEQGAFTIDPLSIRVAPVPQFADSVEKKGLGTYWPMMVPRVSQKQGYAWEFASFLASEQVQRFLFTQSGNISPRLDLISPQSNDPVLGGFAQQNGYIEAIFIPDYKALQAIYQEHYEDFLLDRIDSVTFFERLTEDWQCELLDVSETAIDLYGNC